MIKNVRQEQQLVLTRVKMLNLLQVISEDLYYNEVLTIKPRYHCLICLSVKLVLSTRKSRSSLGSLGLLLPIGGCLVGDEPLVLEVLQV